MSIKKKISIGVAIAISPFAFYIWLGLIGKLLTHIVPWANR